MCNYKNIFKIKINHKWELFTFIAKWNVWMVYCFIHETTIEKHLTMPFVRIAIISDHLLDKCISLLKCEKCKQSTTIFHEICTGVLYVGIDWHRLDGWDFWSWNFIALLLSFYFDWMHSMHKTILKNLNSNKGENITNSPEICVKYKLNFSFNFENKYLKTCDLVLSFLSRLNLIVNGHMVMDFCLSCFLFFF